MRPRTNARCCAVQILYQAEMRGLDDVTDEYIESVIAGYPIQEHLKAFTRGLVRGYFNKRDEVDELITRVTYNWNLKRMTPIDRNVIRIATYEMLFEDEIPVAVSINEAIELAKRYSTRTSGSFVNGVLDSIRKLYVYNKHKETEKTNK